MALLVRAFGFLVILSAIVIWVGVGGKVGDPSRAVVGVAIGLAIWALGMAPRWFVVQVIEDHR